jgi:hypothetical protein
LCQGATLSSYLLTLSTRVGGIIVKASKEGRFSSPEALATNWLINIRSPTNTWSCIRDAGLCGSEAPRGVIFSLVLEWLLEHSPGTDELALIRGFRADFHADSAMDGHLLELEEIVKIKMGVPLPAMHLTLSNNNKTWVQKKEKKGDNKLPVQLFEPTLWMYVERTGAIKAVERTGVVKPKTLDTELHVVQMPPFFPVLDVLLVRRDAKDNTLHFFYVQVTRSEDPFKEHFTDESGPSRTCLNRIKNLVNTAAQAISKGAAIQTSYVMLAPNAEPSKIAAPGQTEDYYFSPADLVPVPLHARLPPKNAMLAALSQQLNIDIGKINDLIDAAAHSVKDVEKYVPHCFLVAQLKAYCTSKELNPTGPKTKAVLWKCIVEAAAAAAEKK